MFSPLFVSFSNWWVYTKLNWSWFPSGSPNTRAIRFVSE